MKSNDLNHLNSLLLTRWRLSPFFTRHAPIPPSCNACHFFQEHELYPQRVNRQKRLMDIEINFADASRGGPAGGRGGRGGPRGGRGDRRGGGGDRGDRGDRGERGDRGDRGERPRADGGEAEKRNEKRGKVRFIHIF
jgi:hypothetical protein